MDPVLNTERLKLTLITHAERGSEELSWLHELRSNKQTTAWSIHPPSASLADTEKLVGTYLPDTPSAAPPSHALPPPTSAEDGAKKAYKLAYAVHERLSSSSSASPGSKTDERATRFIGLVNLVSLSGHYLPLPEHLVVPKEQEKTTLVVELAYSFLPSAWGHGYATEALTAVVDHVKQEDSKAFWAPWEKVWMRVIVNRRNPASLRVMRKLGGLGVEERGVFEWKGEKIFIGGEWRTEDDLHIFGGYLRS